MEELRELLYKYLNEELARLTISNPRSKTEAAKISLRPVLLKGNLAFQASICRDKKVFHQNFNRQEAVEKIIGWMEKSYRQLEIFSEVGQAVALVSKKGKINIKEKKTACCVKK